MTARDWQPGDVALVNDCTNPDAPWEPATCQTSAVKGECEAVWVLHKSGARVWGSVSQARPLVVIDPEDSEAVARLVTEWQAADSRDCTTLDRAQAALREFANPTPPKPEEPTGLGAVVEDASGRRYVRYDHGNGWNWLDGTASVEWGHIAAVRVLSEGVIA